MVIDYNDIKTDISVVIKDLGNFLNLSIDLDSLSSEQFNRGGMPHEKGFKRYVYKFVYGNNGLKKMVPKKLKRKFALTIKSALYNLTLKPVEITEEEQKYARQLLVEECDFYQNKKWLYED